MPITMCVAMPERDELLLLSTSNSTCYMTKIESVMENNDPQVTSTVNLGAWFAHQHPSHYSIKGDYLYVPLANGKEVLRLNTTSKNIRGGSRLQIIKDETDYLRKNKDGGLADTKKCVIF